MFQIFCDGGEVLEKFQKEYEAHPRGFFILAPSGSGKTHFVRNQAKKDWIDGDDLWSAAGAFPRSEWWTEGLAVINGVEQRCDVITKQAMQNGLWVIGASNYWLMPDAIVLPDWELNKQYIAHRENNNYDGGAKSDALEQVMGHRKYMEDMAQKNDIPIFKTIKEASVYLQSLE